MLARGIQYAAQDRVGTAAIEVALGAGAAAIMAVAILISTFGCNNGLILSGPRVYYAMARDRLFFDRAGVLHPVYRTPVFGLIAQAVLGMVLCISGTYGQLLDYVIFAALVFYFLTTLALFRLRRTRPDLPRPVKAFGYPVLPALYMATVAGLLVVLLTTAPLHLAGAADCGRRISGVPRMEARSVGTCTAFVTSVAVKRSHSPQIAAVAATSHETRDASRKPDHARRPSFAACVRAYSASKQRYRGSGSRQCDGRGLSHTPDVPGGGRSREPGKTTLALQFLLEGVSRGERGLYVTLSETADELAGVAASHGWSLDGIDVFELMPDEEALKPDAQYTVFHPSEVELTDTTQAIFESVERVKPARVVFDSLSELRLLARDSLRYRRQILGFKHFFTHHRATVLLLDDRTGDDNDQQLRSLAHGVLLLEQLALIMGGAPQAAGDQDQGSALPRRLSRLHHPDRRRRGLPPSGCRRASYSVQPQHSAQRCARARHSPGRRSRQRHQLADHGAGRLRQDRTGNPVRHRRGGAR